MTVTEAPPNGASPAGVSPAGPAIEGWAPGASGNAAAGDERRPGPSGPGGWRRFEAPALAAGLAALGGAAFASAFARSDLTVPVAAGAAGAAAVSALVTGVARRRLALASLAAVAVLFPLATAAVGGGPSDVVTGLRNGYRVILTTAVPTPADPPVLVVPFAVTALAAFLGSELGQRTRSAAAPVLPSLVVLVGGLAFGLEGSAPDGWVVAGWAALAALVIGLRRRAGRSDPEAGASTGRSTRRSSRRTLAAVPVALVAAAVGHAVGPQLPGADGRERFELRDLVEQPPQPEQLTNPLVLMAGLQAGADDTMFTAETSDPVDRWRLATLDAYDGQAWYSDVSFVPAGNQLPEPPDDERGSGDTTRVTQTIEPSGLEGQWLPVVDRPVEISVDDVLYDTESGVLLNSSSRLPESYQATSIVPRADAAALTGASVASDDEAERAVDVPSGVPQDIRAAAEEITAGSSSAYMKATAIERFLAQSTAQVPFRLAVDQPPTGHSFGHLRCFLFDTERCGRQGSTEQFVAAYALLARLSGLPTRIAVGFTSSGSEGRDEVTAHEATAWTEVKFDGIGWVPFNPVPNPDVTNTPPPPDVAGGGGSPDSQTPTTIPRPEDDAADDQSADGEEATSSGGGAGLWLAAGAAALVALLAAPAVVKTQRRRRRRRAASASERIAGAWDEAVDHLARSGVRPRPTASVRDVVLAGRLHLDQVAEPLVPLGDLVNRARFARRAVADADASAAWQLTDAFADRRRKSRTVPQRTREHFTVRSASARLARLARTGRQAVQTG